MPLPLRQTSVGTLERLQDLRTWSGCSIQCTVDFPSRDQSQECVGLYIWTRASRKPTPVSLHLLSGSTAPHHPRPAWARGRCATSHIPAQKDQMAMWNTGPFRRGNTGAARSHQVAAVFSAPRIQAEGNKEESEVRGRGPNPKADSQSVPAS